MQEDLGAMNFKIIGKLTTYGDGGTKKKNFAELDAKRTRNS